MLGVGFFAHKKPYCSPYGRSSFKCQKELCEAEIPAGENRCSECGTEVQRKTSFCQSCKNIVLEGCKDCCKCGGTIALLFFLDRVSSGTKCNTVLTVGTPHCPSCDQGTSDKANTSKIVQQDDSQINHTVVELDRQSQERGQTGPVDKSSPKPAGQHTGEQHNSSRTSPLDKDWPEQSDPLIGKPQSNELTGQTDQQTGEQKYSGRCSSVENEWLGVMEQDNVELQGNKLANSDDKDCPEQTDQHTGEPRCSEHSTPVDEEGSELREHENVDPQEIVQQDDSQINHTVVELDRQSQERGQTGPVDKSSPKPAGQHTGEQHNSSRTSPLDKDWPEQSDPLIGKPQSNELTGQTDQQTGEQKYSGRCSSVENEWLGVMEQDNVELQGNKLANSDDKDCPEQTDQHTGEPRCSEHSTPVDEEGSELREHENVDPQGILIKLVWFSELID
ncbi:unnamed protein product [Mytilus edulis]|uniref:Uncharacterized protein n=1 Tax=Mytilus edulis TaxID=6550 RepID=A0A8S3QDQ3_MYTED|nr:unnamed protein product [Mytilus edulis]